MLSQGSTKFFNPSLTSFQRLAELYSLPLMTNIVSVSTSRMALIQACAMVSHGKRGFVGEYGVPDDDGRWLDILDSALKYLQENGVNGTYWSAGPRWGDYKLAVNLPIIIR